MTDAELKLYYTNLLIIQFAKMPKARAHIEALAGEAISDQIILQARDAFILNTAIGVQLDMLGKILNTSRKVYGIPQAGNYIGFPTYSDDPGDFFGWPTYASEPTDTTQWLTYLAISTLIYTLSDADFVKLIRYLARLYTMDVTLFNIDALLHEVLNDAIVATDNGDMTITYTIPSDSDPVIFALESTEALPKPAGVGIIIA